MGRDRSRVRVVETQKTPTDHEGDHGSGQSEQHGDHGGGEEIGNVGLAKPHAPLQADREQQVGAEEAGDLLGEPQVTLDDCREHPEDERKDRRGPEVEGDEIPRGHGARLPALHGMTQ